MPKRPPSKYLAPGRLKQLREQLDLNQQEVADALHRYGVRLDDSQIGRYENQETVPNGDALEALCFFLGASPSWLFGREDRELRAYLVRVVRRELGQPEARMLEFLSGMTPERREGYVEGLLARRGGDEPLEQPWMGVPFVPSGLDGPGGPPPSPAGKAPRGERGGAKKRR